MRSACSAPGKLFIAGEYAVLDGAPAIVMAIDRRARVTLASRHGNSHRVRAPGYSPVEGRFRIVKGRFAWKAGERRFGLLESVFNAAHPGDVPPLEIVLDTEAFSEGGVKLGLGASAALTVALSAALVDLGGARQDVAAVARDAHRELQRGRGSGADIAAALAGGLIEFRMPGNAVHRLGWPPGLEFAAFWSGTPADTPEMLGKLAERQRKPSQSALADQACAIAERFRAGHAAAVVAGLRDYTQALAHFDADHALGIFSAGHAEAAAAAERVGVVYKPCGAGGGDVGAAFATDAAQLDEFAEAVAARGMRRLALKRTARGVRVAPQRLDPRRRRQRREAGR